jgi:hypothetical protein
MKYVVGFIAGAVAGVAAAKALARFDLTSQVTEKINAVRRWLQQQFEGNSFQRWYDNAIPVNKEELHG